MSVRVFVLRLCLIKPIKAAKTRPSLFFSSILLLNSKQILVSQVHLKNVWRQQEFNSWLPDHKPSRPRTSYKKGARLDSKAPVDPPGYVTCPMRLDCLRSFSFITMPRFRAIAEYKLVIRRRSAIQDTYSIMCRCFWHLQWWVYS